MSGLGRLASLALKLYCALYLALVLFGLSGRRLPVFPVLAILSTDVAVFALHAPVFGSLLAAWLVLWVALWRSRLRAAPIVGGIVLAAIFFWLHYLTTVGIIAGPRPVAVLLCVLVAAVALVRRRALVRLARAQALPMACIVFLPLTVFAFVAFTMALEPRERPETEAPPHRLTALRHVYDVAVLGGSGKIAAMAGGDYTLHRVDARSGEIEASIPFPEGLRPQRAVFHEETGRLFVIGHDFGDRETVEVAVVAADSWEVTRWLPMAGCHNAIHIDLRESDVVTLCEPDPLVFFYDLEGLGARSEKISDRGVTYTGYDLEMWRDRLVVSGPPWPHTHVRAPGGEARWTRHGLSSMILGLAADPKTGRLYGAHPLEHRIGVFEDGSFEPVASLHTDGMPRDLAIDPERGWLFSGTYFAGRLEQFDLESGERLGAWQVGSLVRGVAWDPLARRAYAAAVDGVYAVDVH